MDINIDEFYDNIVSPFVRDFEREPSNLRCSYGAAWALDSFASHIFYAFKVPAKDDGDYKEKILRPKSNAFKLVSNISTATKHAKITRGRNKAKVKDSSELVSEHGGWHSRFYIYDPNKWKYSIRVKSGENVLPMILEAEKFLLEEMRNLQNGIEKPK